jgi:undecaprenyl-diphosphatase
VIVLYWRRFWDVASACPRASPGAIRFARNIAARLPAVDGDRLLRLRAVKAMLGSPILVAVALIVGGIAILARAAWMRKRPKVSSVEAMSWKTALGIGLIQCLSMIPGVSRSGATIMGALSLGVERKTAAEYSFFLAVPTMLAASGYDLLKTGASLDAAPGGRSRSASSSRSSSPCW